MIVSFRDDETATMWAGRCSRRLPTDIQPIALRKLRLINNARHGGDLPSSRLDGLSDERRPRVSVRINNQWRIFFD
jgi:toxin HigB-1